MLAVRPTCASSSSLAAVSSVQRASEEAMEAWGGGREEQVDPSRQVCKEKRRKAA